MAPISEYKEILTEWYDESNLGDYLSTFARVTFIIFWYLLAPIALYFIIVHLLLFIRSLRLIYGRRVAPDGQLAVIITGATSGFGLATAKRLYKLGFTIFACYYNDQELGYAELLDLKLKPFQVKANNGKKLNFQRPSLFLIKMDVRSSESIERSSEEILHLLNVHNMRLHCLLNNAGTSTDNVFELITRDNIRNIIDTNLTGVIAVTKEFILRIIKDKGRVVNVSSGVYQFPGKGLSLYGATKSAVAYHSDALNADLQAYGASCNVIVPGNSILQSNILFSRMKNLQMAIAQLNEEEQEIYRKSIELNTQIVNHTFRKKIERSPHEDLRRIVDIYKVQLPDLDAKDANSEQKLKHLDEFKKRGVLFKLIQWYIGQSDGSSEKSLDDSHSIQGFEDAIRLAKAPSRIYAGNRYYYHISGPILQFIPPIVCGALSNVVASNLAMVR